jgi:hypothetical protein
MTPRRLGAERARDSFFSGRDGEGRGNEESLGELIRLHFHAAADDLKASAPEAWMASRKLVRRFDEGDGAAKSRLRAKMKKIQGAMDAERASVDWFYLYPSGS